MYYPPTRKEAKKSPLSGDLGVMYYTYTDHLGSIVAVTNHNASVIEKQSFDAWGQSRNPNTWEPETGNKQLVTGNRGYTGHEHLTEFGLINMNGRLYDPVLGRMLSPDNYIQAPDFSQNFNRYSYVVNNPLRYTDPSGEYFLIDDIILGLIGGTINAISNAGNIHSFGDGLSYFGIGFAGGFLSEYITPMGSAALVGGANAALTSYNQTGSIDVGAVIQGTVISGITAGVTMGVSQAITPYVGGFFSNVTSPVVRSAVTQGVVGATVGAIGGGLGAKMNGGSFWQGAAQGAVWGGGLGLATGAYSGFQYAKKNNINPWTGKSNINPFNEGKQPTIEHNLVKVRHHTSKEAMNRIKKDGYILPSRKSQNLDVGVDVETQPFGNPTTAQKRTGSFAHGAYIEFEIKSNSLTPTNVGTGNTARIITEGKVLQLNQTTTKYVKIRIWYFW